MMAIDVAIICLMAIGLVVCVGEPLVRRASYKSQGREDNNGTETLLLQKEMLYVAIRDLDFDFQTGKVDQKDYDELRRQLERDAVHILRQLDAVDPLIAFDNEIERQVLDLRRRGTAKARGSSQDVCPSCGTPLESGDNFCPACGRALRLV
jgi:zinc-ribbon domain